MPIKTPLQDRFSGEIRLDPAGEPRDESATNLASIIAYLEYCGRTILLTGDGLDTEPNIGLGQRFKGDIPYRKVCH